MAPVQDTIRAELLRSISEAARVLTHARATSVALLETSRWRRATSPTP